MQQLWHKARSLLDVLPPGQRVVAAAAVVAVLLLGAGFVRWVSAPTYTVLYTGLDDKTLSRVINQLEGQAVPFKIEAGGSRVLVPRQDVFRLRASLAESGIGGRTSPRGYEILDEQGLAVSDFRQRVDYQRAIEGELSRTLMAMDGVDAATVHLALPDDNPFERDRRPVSASVLLDTSRQLSAAQVDTVVFLVSSAVDGLDASQVTVADASGTVLAAPGSGVGDGVTGDRNLRATREFEAGLTADIQRLLRSIGGAAAPSVVVRAQLDFDERSIEEESYDRETAVAIRERSSTERLQGSGANAPIGVAGVSGGLAGQAGGDVDYEKADSTTEFGVNRQVVRTRPAPGRVEKLSIAIVMDDGAAAGIAVPPPAEVSELVSGAVGLDEARGDTIKVTQLALPAAEAAAPGTGPADGLLDMLPRVAGAIVLLLAAAALALMAIRGRSSATPVRLELGRLPGPAALESGDGTGDPTGLRLPEPRDVRELVERQPEEIAAVLRSWLSDRRR